MTESAAQFYQLATIVLAGFTGCLLSLPFLDPGQPMSCLYVLGGTALGLLAGYRRRHFRPFFYISLLSTLVLSTLLATSMTGV